MRIALTFLLMIFAVLRPACAASDLVVVVAAGSGVEPLSRDQVINIFLGRYRQLPWGRRADPLDAADESRARFYRLLVDKNLAEINAYWSHLIFAGKTTQPSRVQGAQEVIRQVLTRPGGIAYLDRSQVDARLTVVYTVGKE